MVPAVARESFSGVAPDDGVAARSVPADGPVLDWAGEAGRRWSQVADRVESQLAPVSDVLFTAAGLTPGERVLDVGCGRGSTTRRAAGVVGADGWVSGIDIAVGLIEEAHTIPPPPGAAPVEWMVGDAQTAWLSAGHYDAVISRFGTLFFDDPVVAFANLRGCTRRGGRLCMAVWQRRDRSPILQRALDVAAAAADAIGYVIDTGAPDGGPFAFGDPAFVRPVLDEAGWADVAVRQQEVDMLLFGPGSVTDAVDAGIRFGPLEVALREAPAPVVDAVRAALIAELRAHHDGTGVRMSGAIAIVDARCP
jgi:SAM-dependent methyltransferase